MAFPMPKTTNLYRLKQAVDNAYGRAGRASVGYAEGGVLGDINSVIQTVCEDFPIFTMKTADLAATVAGTSTITPPTDFWLPIIFTAKWKAGVTINPTGILKVHSRSEMDAEYPYWKNSTITTSTPYAIVIDWATNEWEFYPTPSTTGMIAQLMYPTTPFLFTGIAGEDASSSTRYVDVPDIFIERLLAVKIAAQFAFNDRDYDKQKALEERYMIEAERVTLALLPITPQQDSQYDGPLETRAKAIRL